MWSILGRRPHNVQKQADETEKGEEQKKNKTNFKLKQIGIRNKNAIKTNKLL